MTIFKKNLTVNYDEKRFVKTMRRNKFYNKLLVRTIVTVGLFITMSYGNITDITEAVDYSQSKHWLELPSHIDLNKKVDIFYVYPTTFERVNDEAPFIAEIDDAGMLEGSKAAYAIQATAFETIGDIYAPYYRQVDATYLLSLPLKDQDKVIGNIPTTDVTAAFDYYIKNYNKGRPFILAGHFQGSNVLEYLLSEYMKKHPDVYKKMVAAYIIGYSVTADYLVKNPHLKFAKGAMDTGVIITYNTEALTIEGKNPVVLPGAIAINPITWSRNEEIADANLNLGSLSLNENLQVIKGVVLKNYADAQVSKARGVLICRSVDANQLYDGSVIFGKGIYHNYDYPLYYYNIRENAKNRTDNFLRSCSKGKQGLKK